MFEQWKRKELHLNKVFITDGVIKEELWLKSNYRIMFLLKEAYDSTRTEGTWSLPDFIKGYGVKGRTFKPMAQWAYGLQQVIKTNEVYPFIEKNPEVETALFSSAIVNLKKSGGKNRSNYEDLKKYVNEDWSLIHKQINKIEPKIIICGNTWSLIKDKLNYKKVSDCAFVSEGVLYIDYWHPANRAANLMNYYAICAIVQMALKVIDSEL